MHKNFAIRYRRMVFKTSLLSFSKSVFILSFAKTLEQPTFKSVFTTEDSDSIPKLDNYNCKEDLKNIDIQEDEIQQMLEKLQPRKAPGPDGIPPEILSAATKELTRPLSQLFRQTIQEGKLPDEWKKALVSPVYKRKGSKTSPNNYRPVSLTCIVCKIME